MLLSFSAHSAKHSAGSSTGQSNGFLIRRSGVRVPPGGPTQKEIMLLKRQETVEFNPANKEHRAAVRAFLRRKAWVDSPIRFAHDPTFGSVADQVQAKLLDWYVDQEETKLNKGKKILSNTPLRMVA